MVIGRFAPSPTGRLHLGNLRTALVAWLSVRASADPESKFLIRFEDLDTPAVRQEHYQSQLDDLAAIGLDWDEPIVRQSDRRDRYIEALATLAENDLIYPCFCSRKEVREAASAPHLAHAGHHYPGTCRELSTAQRAERALTRPPAQRLRAAGAVLAFDDLVMGASSFEVDDFVVVRNEGTPAYHLVVVVDDAAQDVDLVVRADDLLESTSRHLLLYQLLGLEAPRHAHVPLVLAPTGDRLAKRHGAVNLDDRAALGETPAQVLRFLAESLGLVEADNPARTVAATDLRQRFDFGQLPTEPLTLPAHYLNPET
ncbi:MAG: tRNA glutamyl-Q(34) synthetase GluQRS [Acidimicrobiales bacterium]